MTIEYKLKAYLWGKPISGDVDKLSKTIMPFINKEISNLIKEIAKDIEDQSFILEDGFYKDCKVYHESVKGYLEDKLKTFSR